MNSIGSWANDFNQGPRGQLHGKHFFQKNSANYKFYGNTDIDISLHNLFELLYHLMSVFCWEGLHKMWETSYANHDDGISSNIYRL